MSWSQLRRRLVATTAIGVVVAAVCAWGFAADRLDGVQNRWEDLLQPGLAAADDVVIVGIDRTSIGAVGAWPWPREVQAELLAAIGDGHPSVVLYDVLMDQSREGDDALIEAMRTTPTVLPTALTLTVGNDGPPGDRRRRRDGRLRSRLRQRASATSTSAMPATPASSARCRSTRSTGAASPGRRSPSRPSRWSTARAGRSSSVPAASRSATASSPSTTPSCGSTGRSR